MTLESSTEAEHQGPGQLPWVTVVVASVAAGRATLPVTPLGRNWKFRVCNPPGLGPVWLGPWPVFIRALLLS